MVKSNTSHRMGTEENMGEGKVMSAVMINTVAHPFAVLSMRHTKSCPCPIQERIKGVTAGAQEHIQAQKAIHTR